MHLATTFERYDDFATRKGKAEMRQKEEEEKWKRKWELDQALKEFHEPTEEYLRAEARKRRHWEQQLEYERHLMELHKKESKEQKERDEAQELRWKKRRMDEEQRLAELEISKQERKNLQDMSSDISIPIQSNFNFSGPPLGFQKNQYFVNMRL